VIDWEDCVVPLPRGKAVGPITLHAARGRLLGLVGPNGAGKTTILKSACGLLPRSRGSVRVVGNQVRTGVMPRGCAALIEEPRFVKALSGRDNLVLCAAGRRPWLDEIDGALVDADLIAAADNPVSNYSQGMRQRLGIVRSLLGGPAVVLLDEPTNGLDPQGIRWLRIKLERLLEAGTTVVLSSHLLAEVEVLADDIALVAEGRLVAVGRAPEIVASSSSLELFYFESLAGNHRANRRRTT
jgi:ABC-2 type transport system ATP-binding protein